MKEGKHYKFLSKIVKDCSYLNCVINHAILEIEDFSTKWMRLKNRFFIYILIDNYKIIYVGRSENIYERMVQHQADKQFTHIILLEYSYLEDMYFFEKKIIKHFRPNLNILWIKYE